MLLLERDPGGYVLEHTPGWLLEEASATVAIRAGIGLARGGSSGSSRARLIRAGAGLAQGGTLARATSAARYTRRRTDRRFNVDRRRTPSDL